MLAETTIELEAGNPATNRMRRWSVELGQDLLGMWIVDVEFGRIGSRGRRLRRVFTDQPTAHAYMGLGLDVAQQHRRGSASPIAACARPSTHWRCSPGLGSRHTGRCEAAALGSSGVVIPQSQSGQPQLP